MPVSPLLTVFGLLLGRATTVSTSYILLLLGLGLHLLARIAWLVTSSSEVDAVLKYALKIIH